jgi:putative spermidine/putrescine transport system substrate-binding protein
MRTKATRKTALFSCFAFLFVVCAAPTPVSDSAAPIPEKKIVSYGQPDDWANWKEMFSVFDRKYGCTHEDTNMSSAEEIQKFIAEKNNPIADTSDIGLMWGPIATKVGAVAAYKNSSWDKVGDWAKDDTGYFCATYLGVPVFLVNARVVRNIPQSWNDLLKPEYKNMVCIVNPQNAALGQNTVLAASYALGGSISNLDAGIHFFSELQRRGNIKTISVNAATLVKGEVPIYITYDFLAKRYQDLAKLFLDLRIVLPKEGSIFAPSALIINKYAPHPKLARAFLDFVMSDEGQLIFAKGYAYPIRAVEGNLVIPKEIQGKMLPASFYVNCGKPKEWDKVSPEEIASRWSSEVLGQ